MTNAAQKIPIIQEAMYPILTEVKIMFLQYLSYGLTIQEKRIRIVALNKACETIQKFNLERFIADE